MNKEIGLLHKFLSQPSVKDYLKKHPIPIVVLPLGSLEIHEYISMGFDTILAEEVAKKISQELDLLIGPILPIGYSAEHIGEGVVWLKPETYLKVLYDIIDSYLEGGFKGVLLLNCHAGNKGLVNATVTQYRRWYQKLKIGRIDVWSYLGDCFGAKSLEDYCIIENSLALYFNLIDKNKLLKDKNPSVKKLEESSISPWLTNEMEGILYSTLPQSSAEIGERVFNCAVDKIIGDIRKWIEH